MANWILYKNSLHTFFKSKSVPTLIPATGTRFSLYDTGAKSAVPINI